MARKSTGRKRERGDHSLEPNKREHSDNTDERVMDPPLYLEEMEEVEELKDKATGGLAFPAGVIKMLDIMHTITLDKHALPHAAELALAKRCLLAQIVASTSRADCARLFLKEGGLDQLQAWLREALQAAADFPACRPHIEMLLVALLIAMERLKETPERLQEGTLKIVALLGAAEGQFTDGVKLRARRLGSSWGPAGRPRGGWDGGESSASGAEVPLESKGDTSPSTSVDRDEPSEANSSRSARAGTGQGAMAPQRGPGAGEGGWSRDAGVEEAAGIMRLTMNSPVAGPLPPAPGVAHSFGTGLEESGSGGPGEGGEPERSKYAKIEGSPSGMAGGLPGGAPDWGPEPRQRSPTSRRQGREGPWGAAGRGGYSGSNVGSSSELVEGLKALRVGDKEGSPQRRPRQWGTQEGRAEALILAGTRQGWAREAADREPSSDEMGLAWQGQDSSRAGGMVLKQQSEATRMSKTRGDTISNTS